MNTLFLQEALDYDCNTGLFTWKKRPLHHFKNTHGMNIWNSRYAHRNAGTVFSPCKESLYKRIKIVVNNNPHMAHQLAWRFCYGEIPDGLFVDHIDGNATNNAIRNLRLVTHSMNHRNRKVQSNNTTGVPGIRQVKNKWSARIKIQGNEIHLGTFDTKEQAIQHRKEYALKNGFTERHHTK